MGCAAQQKDNYQPLIIFDEFMIKRQSFLSQGKFGKVWKCQDISSGNLYALKEISLQTHAIEESYQRQIDLLNNLNEKLLKRSIKMVSHSMQRDSRNRKTGMILFQLGQTSLFDEINDKDFTQMEIVKILLSLCFALEELHQHSIYHMDIKPENIVIIDNEYKLIDFGSAITKTVRYNDLGKEEKQTFKEFVAYNSTFSYRSPELIQPVGKIIGAPSDIWMLGVIAFILAFEEHPFTGKEQSFVLNGKLSYPKQGFLTDLIKQMLSVDPSQRPTVTNLIERFQKKLDQSN